MSLIGYFIKLRLKILLKFLASLFRFVDITVVEVLGHSFSFTEGLVELELAEETKEISKNETGIRETMVNNGLGVNLPIVTTNKGD